MSRYEDEIMEQDYGLDTVARIIHCYKCKKAYALPHTRRSLRHCPKCWHWDILEHELLFDPETIAVGYLGQLRPPSKELAERRRRFGEGYNRKALNGNSQTY